MANVGMIRKLTTYPLKGGGGVESDALTISPQFGVYGDRRYAVRRHPGDMTCWSGKTDFVSRMTNARMAQEETQLFLRRPAQPGGMNDLEPGYLSGLADRFGVTVESIQDTGGAYNLCDTEGGQVSILNLASVRALSEFMRREVDPSLFRMNVWLEGLDPFEELDWVDTFPGTKMVVAGECLLRVDDACERCLAINANPATGRHDLETLEALTAMMVLRGYASPQRHVPHVMGVLAVPVYQGSIRVGDEVRRA